MKMWTACLLTIATSVLTSGCNTSRQSSQDDEFKADKAKARAPTEVASASKRQSSLKAKFEKELGLAYKVEGPRKSGNRKFVLRAAPSSLEVSKGKALAVWAYNDQVPGPVLRVRLGEEVEVTLKNALPQPTTIHWHGVRVPNAMDGVPGVTQDPIEPGASYTYRFVPKDAGTFWFHPHVRGAEQVERGLYGVLIVDDAVSLPYSRDEVWVLDDWRLGRDGQIDPNFVTRHDLAHDGRRGGLVTVNGSRSEELVVRPGERLRLRLVNPSNGRVYRPDFSGLAARVIAVDGMYTSAPVSAEGFEIAPGNRLDLDIQIPAASPPRTIAIQDRFSSRRPFTLATVRIEGEPVSVVDFPSPTNPQIPKWNGAAEQPVDVTYVLNARRGGEHGIQWTINGRAWGEHRVTEFKGGQWTKVRFQNDSSRLHPMHIHGQFFKVLARNGAAVSEEYLRDTVLLHGKETIDIGMVPVDWGSWMMHCHILEHAESGMMTVLEVAPPSEGKK